MRLIGRELLQQLKRKHADSRSAVEAWEREVKAARWSTPLDLLRRYPRADFPSGCRVVFDVKGNSYRIAATVDFGVGIVRVTHAGTHAEYDKWKL
jgi:mRNA interferase HigB